MPLRGTIRRYGTYRNYRRAVTAYRYARSAAGYLRGSRRTSAGRRGVYGRPRQYRAMSTKVLRKRKLYRRTLPSTRQRSQAISTGLVQGGIETKVPAITNASELAFRDIRNSSNVITTDGDNYVTVAMGSMYFQSMPWPYLPTDTDSFATKKRESNHLMVSGFKIHRSFNYEVESPSDVGPIVVNWCLIQGRMDVDGNELAAAIVTNTFREHSSIENETLDHDNYGASSDWSGNMNWLPLNPDNKFKVLVHKREKLYPRSATLGRVGNFKPPHIWEIRKWYKLGKIFSFENSAKFVPQKNIYELFWYNTETDDKFPANPVGSNYLTTYRNNVTYYSDP